MDAIQQTSLAPVAGLVRRGLIQGPELHHLVRLFDGRDRMRNLPAHLLPFKQRSLAQNDDLGLWECRRCSQADREETRLAQIPVAVVRPYQDEPLDAEPVLGNQLPDVILVEDDEPQFLGAYQPGDAMLNHL